MDEETYPLTEIDQIANGTNLLMLKALLRHFPSGNRQMLAMVIKLMELKNIQAYYQSHSPADMQAMDLSATSPMEILSDLLRFCPQEQRASFAQAQNIIETIQMFENMQDMFGGEYSFGESEGESNRTSESEPERESQWMDEG